MTWPDFFKRPSERLKRSHTGAPSFAVRMFRLDHVLHRLLVFHHLQHMERRQTRTAKITVLDAGERAHTYSFAVAGCRLPVDVCRARLAPLGATVDTLPRVVTAVEVLGRDQNQNEGMIQAIEGKHTWQPRYQSPTL